MLVFLGFLIGACTTMTDMRFSVSTSSNKESQPRWKQGDVNTALTAKVLRKMNYADKEATLRVS